MNVRLRVLLPLILAFTAAAALWPLFNGYPFSKHFAQWLGWLAFVSFSLSFILSMRARWLDLLADGLDKTYAVHHRLGQLTFLLLISHVAVLSLRWLGRRPAKAFWFPFPVHPRAFVNIGSYGFWILVVLLLLTFWKAFPYRQWKMTHKLMGIPFALGTLHIALQSNGIIFILTIVLGSCAIAAWIWDLGLHRLIYRWHPYQVVDIERPTGRHLIVKIRPKKRGLKLCPGQYLFTQFAGQGLETHPFTPFTEGQDKLCLSIKVSGDYTERLHAHLKNKVGVKISRPYGTFNYTRGSHHQIWIAGGVGVSPFLAWAEALTQKEAHLKKVILYYCVHSQEDAIHLQYLRRLQEKLPYLEVHHICTAKQGHITATQIKKEVSSIATASIFLCGPPKMIKDLRRQFIQQGCPRKNMYYEAFAFRS